MPQTTLSCDQAIFTSVRTPMGEGYRVIAASKGIKPSEKQAITRSSPSHEALCVPIEQDRQDGPLAAACYPLETGRLALSISGFAGSEQSGRGGGRVYTHIVVFDREQLAACGFNPFQVLRAMIAFGLNEPQLKPPTVLPDLSLPVDTSNQAFVPPPCLDPDVRIHILRSLFEGENVVVNMSGQWLETAEALLMGLPGPLREDASFSAGMQFSLSRMHRLELLFDDKGKAKLRTTGQKVEFIDPDSMEAPKNHRSPWFDYVERCYATGNMTDLARRTSRYYTDTSLAACERIGTLFKAIDEVQRLDCQAMLASVNPSFSAEADGTEAEAHEELIQVVQRHLPERFSATSIEQARELWTALVTLWRQPGRAEAFARPLVMRMAVHIAELDPLEAARLVSDIVEDVDRSANGATFASTIDEVLARLLIWVQSASPAQRDEAIDVAHRWATIRPSCETISQISAACEPVPVNDSAN